MLKHTVIIILGEIAQYILRLYSNDNIVVPILFCGTIGEYPSKKEEGYRARGRMIPAYDPHTDRKLALLKDHVYMMSLCYVPFNFTIIPLIDGTTSGSIPTKAGCKSRFLTSCKCYQRCNLFYFSTSLPVNNLDSGKEKKQRV